jgi:hypothetical protein
VLFRSIIPRCSSPPFKALKESQPAEQGKKVIVPGETVMIIPLDPVAIHLIGRKAAAKIWHLLKQLDFMLTGKCVCCDKPGQSSADDAYPHNTDP